MVLVLLLSFARIANAADPPASQADEPYFDVGDFHYEVSTDSPAAQQWFDRGLAMCIAFNHEEGVRCFERALAIDPGMAMGYWGLAYGWGPNINNVEIEPHQIAEANLAVRLAKLHLKNATRLEQELIEAISHRHTTPVPDDRDPLNKAYAEAMRKVYQAHPDDPLVAALFAESLMMLRPWNQWAADGTPAAETPEIVQVLEDGLKQSPDFPALCHLYIHAMEASPDPAVALPAANRLRDAMPGAGHLVHMPSHIDVLLGDYPSVIRTNQKAIEVDDEFLKREGAINFYTYYRLHNYHFVVYGAMFDGQSELALRAARQLQEQVPEEMLKTQTDFLDAFMPMPLHVLIRFGRWDDILNEPEPADYLPMSRSIRHYARALAYAATGRIAEAETEQSAFKLSRATVPETSMLFNNTSQDILGVAEEMVAGEIAYRKGETEAAFEHLRAAIRLDDALNYDEPWAWMQPARHALGALLVESGKPVEAEAVYRADLKRHPNNPWALQGLAECLAVQGKSAEAANVKSQLQTATERADVSIDRSCYCRLQGFEQTPAPDENEAQPAGQ
jgi:tetratricopeptide (TPR) repeat protein